MEGYDEWTKTTKMSAEVKAEVRKRLDEMKMKKKEM